MRAQEIINKIRAVGPEESIGTFFPQASAVNEVFTLRSKIEALEGIPGFENEFRYLRDSEICRSSSNAFECRNPNIWGALRGEVSLTFQRLIGLEMYLKSILSHQKEESVFVKLPETHDLSFTAAFLVRLEKALSQLLLQSEGNGRIELQGWESGSLWMEVYLGTAQAVAIVGSGLWAAAVISKKNQEAKLHAEYARGLRLRNDGLENLLEAQKVLLSEFVDAEVINLAAAHYNGTDNVETLGRVKFAIKEFSEMIEQGAEIHPALQAPEEVKNLFPNLSNLHLLESKTKLLTDQPKPE